jgi:hypothetical protein
MENMAPTEATKKHVMQKYVQPARERGEKTIEVRVGSVLKELGWSNRTPSVFSTLASKSFQNEAGLELIEKLDGPQSGGPSTTWRFIYRVLDRPGNSSPRKKEVTPNGAGLMSLAGICTSVFRKLGGGEAFLKAERDWGPDVWERYEADRAKEVPKREGK